MKTIRTLELAVQFYNQVEQIKIAGNLRDQLLRAASSIALNLSEGNAKLSIKEKKRYYQTAYASLQECKTVLRLAQCSDASLVDMADKLGAWLFNLMKSEIKTISFRNS